MLEALQLEFMRNALMAGVLAAVLCGVIGTLVVVNRIVFLSGGVAHAAYGGIGLAFFFGFSYLWGVMGFSLAAALIMGAVSLKSKERADTIIGVIWAVGMALGIILLDLTPGYNIDLMSYLFGSILAVPRSDLWLMLGLNLVVLLTVAFCYNAFVSLSYDEEFARVRGIPTKSLYLVLIALIALSIVMIIQVVGLILVIALLTIPPFIAEKYAGSLLSMMLYSIALNLVFTLSGMWLAFSFNLTSGAAIIMVAAVGFFISLMIERFRKK